MSLLRSEYFTFTSHKCSVFSSSLSVSINLLERENNSNSLKIGSRVFILICSLVKSSAIYSVGTSAFMVTKVRDRCTVGWQARRFSFCFPFNSSIWAYIPSISPYLYTRVAALLGPIPEQPGTLSAASPINPKISTTWLIFSIPK